MTSASNRGSLARIAARLLVLVAVALLGVSTAAGAARKPHRGAAKHPGRAWSRPFAISRPQTGDVLPPVVAFGPSGQAAVAFGLYNIDFPERSTALVAIRAATGKLARPRLVPNAQEVLALAYEGSALELETGNSPAQFPCCSAARVLTYAAGGFRHQRVLVSQVNGAALGVLVALPGSHVLAAVASGAGAWTAQSHAVNRFGAVHRLTSSSVSPQTVAGAGLPHGRSAVAWTETPAVYSNVPASSLWVATGTATRPPQHGRLVLNRPSGHAIDELALAGGASGPTAGWTESWYDSSGTYRAEAAVADLNGGRVRTFQVAGQLASGVTLAADARGDQVLAWKTCDPIGDCSVRAVSRAAGRPFGAPQRLGAIDVGEDPAAAVAPDGEALVGWVSGGHVLIANRPGAGGRFGRGVTVSSIPGGSAVTVAFGPSGQALAAWTQGVAKPSVFAAFRP